MNFFDAAFLWPKELFSGKGRDRLKKDIREGEGYAEIGNPLHGLTAGYEMTKLGSVYRGKQAIDRINDGQNPFSREFIGGLGQDQVDNVRGAFKENWPVLALGNWGIGGSSGSSGGAAGGGAGLGSAGYTPAAGDLAAIDAAGISAATNGTSGASAASGMGFGSPAAGGFNWMDMLKQQGGGMGGGQQQPQQMSPAPQNAPRRGLGQPGFMDKIQAGLFPVDSRAAEAIGPEALKQQRNQALMRMGLGMMAASGQGAGLGESLFTGLDSAQRNLDGALQRGYENAREVRQEQRQSEQDAIAQERYTTEREYGMDRDKLEDERWGRQFDAQTKMRELQLKQQQQQQEELAQYRKDMLNARAQNVNQPEVRVTDRGMFERQKDGSWKLVAGTEPTGVAGRPIPQGMANDLKTNASVIGQIDKLLPQLRTEGGDFSPVAKNAFGARNAIIKTLTPDALSDNVKNLVDSEGTDLRATVTNLNSYIVKERNGAAVTVAEFARQRGFLPTDSDSVEVAEKKLINLRDALESEQQYLLDFAESQGYKPPPSSVRPKNLGTGSWSIEEVP